MNDITMTRREQEIWYGTVSMARAYLIAGLTQAARKRSRAANRTVCVRDRAGRVCWRVAP